jgi:hypothetical protein
MSAAKKTTDTDPTAEPADVAPEAAPAAEDAPAMEVPDASTGGVAVTFHVFAPTFVGAVGRIVAPGETAPVPQAVAQRLCAGASPLCTLAAS